MAARYTLETEVQYVKGVGTKLAQVLSKLNLYTLGDLLFHLPRRYEDRRQFRKIAHARPGDAVTVSGKLVTVDNVKVRNLTLTKAYLDDGSGVLELVWYNQPYIKDTLNKLRNSQIVAYGIVKESPYGLQMETPEWEDLPDGADPDSLLSVNRIVPIYPLTEGIRQKRMRQIHLERRAVCPPRARNPAPQRARATRADAHPTGDCADSLPRQRAGD
jgi:ATP-dependent DNA helicase RecG